MFLSAAIWRVILMLVSGMIIRMLRGNVSKTYPSGIVILAMIGTLIGTEEYI